mmetsp:Transcript_26678/g.91817  ORF Transcript_26678/g.91817 Transcript_26678/m.91817 type:complete len:299 (-) Transcript_26678:1724-2620(-)
MRVRREPRGWERLGEVGGAAAPTGARRPRGLGFGSGLEFDGGARVAVVECCVFPVWNFVDLNRRVPFPDRLPPEGLLLVHFQMEHLGALVLDDHPGGRVGVDALGRVGVPELAGEELDAGDSDGERLVGNVDLHEVRARRKCDDLWRQRDVEPQVAGALAPLVAPRVEAAAAERRGRERCLGQPRRRGHGCDHVRLREEDLRRRELGAGVARLVCAAAERSVVVAELGLWHAGGSVERAQRAERRGHVERDVRRRDGLVHVHAGVLELLLRDAAQALAFVEEARKGLPRVHGRERRVR